MNKYIGPRNVGGLKGPPEEYLRNLIPQEALDHDLRLQSMQTVLAAAMSALSQVLDQLIKSPDEGRLSAVEGKNELFHHVIVCTT